MSTPHHLQRAMSLSYRHIGYTGKNPSVGCIIANENTILGYGITQPGGNPHAEQQAIEMAGTKSKGAEAFVTLEPCAHKCAPALIKSGITKLHIAEADPTLQSAGINMLKDAGIEVQLYDIQVPGNQAFMHVQQHNRPFVTVKLAVSADGKIATHTGDSKWITCTAARAYAHKLRAQHDGILVGSSTFAADAPTLTCRLPGLSHTSPKRFVLSSNKEADGEGFTTIALDEIANLPTTHHVNRLLVEGGGNTAASLLQKGWMDELIYIRAPLLVGGDGRDSIASLDISDIENSQPLSQVSTQHLGECVLERYIILSS